MTYVWLEPNFIPPLITYSISFIVLLVGSITDLRTREVPDWINYGLIMAGLWLNLLFSAVYSDPSYIINSIIGLAIFFGIAYIMFYAGQWGGGDSKMLMGIGAMIGIDVSFKAPQFLTAFFINALFAGAAYGLLWSLFLAYKNWKKFLREFRKSLSRKEAVMAKKAIALALVLSVIILFFVEAYPIRLLILLFMLMALLTMYLWSFARAVEKSSMYKLVEPSRLTEGDWIVRNVYFGKEYICGPKDLGIEKRQIRRLAELYKKRKVSRILIKEGVPFVPSFLAAFIITWFFGSVVYWFI